MSESRLFSNTTEPNQLADDTIADAQTTEDITADVSEQTGSKKQRRKRTKQSDSTNSTAETADVSNPNSAESTNTAEMAEGSAPDKSYKTGDPIDIRLALLYSSSVASKHFKGIRGRYYIWNDTVHNGRVRLTDSPSGVGKPERIIGWVKLKNI